MKVDSNYVKITTEDAAKIYVYAMAGNSSATDRFLALCTLTEGELAEIGKTATYVDGAAIAKYEFTVDAAGEYYLGSTKSGINLYYIAVEYAAEGSDSVDPPAEQPV